jgi:hypothetical protein
VQPPPNADASGYLDRRAARFVAKRRPRPVRKTLWSISWVLWLVIDAGLLTEWITHRNNFAGDFVLIVFWSIFTGSVMLAPWFSKRTADGLTQFSAQPMTRRDRLTGEPLHRTARGTLWRPGEVRPSYFETHPPPLDWHSIVAASAWRLREILPTGIEVRAEKLSLVLTSGEARRTVHLGSMFASPPQDEAPRVLRGCEKMLSQAQSFVVEQRREPWPQRPGAPGSESAQPSARIVKGEIVLGYGDHLGPVAVLSPIPWPGDPASLD